VVVLTARPEERVSLATTAGIPAVSFSISRPTRRTDFKRLALLPDASAERNEEPLESRRPVQTTGTAAG
jgi:hypothetical protein